jgi:hypothetical protein
MACSRGWPVGWVALLISSSAMRVRGTVYSYGFMPMMIDDECKFDEIYLFKTLYFRVILSSSK